MDKKIKFFNTVGFLPIANGRFKKMDGLWTRTLNHDTGDIENAYLDSKPLSYKHMKKDVIQDAIGVEIVQIVPFKISGEDLISDGFSDVEPEKKYAVYVSNRFLYIVELPKKPTQKEHKTVKSIELPFLPMCNPSRTNRFPLQGVALSSYEGPVLNAPVQTVAPVCPVCGARHPVLSFPKNFNFMPNSRLYLEWEIDSDGYKESSSEIVDSANSLHYGMVKYELEQNIDGRFLYKTETEATVSNFRYEYTTGTALWYNPETELYEYRDYASYYGYCNCEVVEKEFLNGIKIRHIKKKQVARTYMGRCYWFESVSNPEWGSASSVETTVYIDKSLVLSFPKAGNGHFILKDLETGNTQLCDAQMNVLVNDLPDDPLSIVDFYDGVTTDGYHTIIDGKAVKIKGCIDRFQDTNFGININPETMMTELYKISKSGNVKKIGEKPIENYTIERPFLRDYEMWRICQELY